MDLFICGIYEGTYKPPSLANPLTIAYDAETSLSSPLVLLYKSLSISNHPSLFHFLVIISHLIQKDNCMSLADICAYNYKKISIVAYEYLVYILSNIYKNDDHHVEIETSSCHQTNY
ncbi:protein of unknown function [Petrocella atlantisensis]|uniref:Uncharacterized protein n=1 Tax=Petrocella atlantisensis TaxID=2173034 RepID=A0A3P7S3L0_9FIRM|nr:protein of unknown function [Petrocella atlantisensis]